jgi:hypothetical protein
MFALYNRQSHSMGSLRGPLDNRTNYDLVIVGSGLSCCYSLLALFAQLGRAPSIKARSIAVVEKAGQFWTGVPFGQRSSVNSLMITPLSEFMAQKLAVQKTVA